MLRYYAKFTPELNDNFVMNMYNEIMDQDKETYARQ